MIPGQEIFFKSVCDQFKSPQDVIVASIHFFLIHQGFRCVGSGHEFAARVDNLKGSELLPENWNNDSNQSFVLHYVTESENGFQTLLFRYDNINGHWYANFLLNPGENSFDLEVKPEDFTTPEYGSYDRAFVDKDSFSKLFNLMEKEVLPKLSKGKKDKKKNDNKEEGKDKLRVSDDQSSASRTALIPEPGGPGPSTDGRSYPIPTHPSIGGADLDPFGRGIGGGMLFDPRDPRHFPRRPNFRDDRFMPSPSGLIPRPPPGARFDPFGPPPPETFPRGRGRGGRGPDQGFPDPDHFRPPDYDDMFM